MPKNNSKAQREYRKQGARERQAKHDGLTLHDKMDKANARPGDSTREYKRYTAVAEGLGWDKNANLGD